MVELRDVAVVLAKVLGQILVGLLEAGVGLDRQVRLVRPDGQEERLGLVSLVRQPVDRLIHHQRGREARENADGLPLRTKLDGFLWLGAALFWVAIQWS